MPRPPKKAMPTVCSIDLFGPQTKLSFYFTASHCLDITVMFEESTYSVDENDGPAQPVLVLSNPSSMIITVQVTNTDGSATGEYCSILINY